MKLLTARLTGWKERQLLPIRVALLVRLLLLQIHLFMAEFLFMKSIISRAFIVRRVISAIFSLYRFTVFPISFLIRLLNSSYLFGC